MDADHDASQEDVDSAAAALQAAIDALEKAPVEGPKADKTALKEAIDKASAVDSSKYTTRESGETVRGPGYGSDSV